MDTVPFARGTMKKVRVISGVPWCVCEGVVEDGEEPAGAVDAPVATGLGGLDYEAYQLVSLCSREVMR